MASTETPAKPPAGRRWWLVDLAEDRIPGGHLIEARTAARALTIFRAEKTEYYISAAGSRRAAAELVRIGQPTVYAGPLTAGQAFQRELGWTWAREMCEPRYTAGERAAPSGPATRGQAVSVLGKELTARIERELAEQYRVPPAGRRWRIPPPGDDLEFVVNHKTGNVHILAHCPRPGEPGYRRPRPKPVGEAVVEVFCGPGPAMLCGTRLRYGLPGSPGDLVPWFPDGDICRSCVRCLGDQAARAFKHPRTLEEEDERG